MMLAQSETELMVLLRPGTNVNVVLNTDIDREIVDIRNSVIFDTNGTAILLSQTTPPFLKGHIGKAISVTHIVEKTHTPIRVGFAGRVIDLIDGYTLESNEVVDAVRIVRTGSIKSFDVRMHYRVRPNSRSGIQMKVAGEEVVILDVSLGGARLCHSIANPITTVPPVKIFLSIDGREYDVEARISNVWNHPEVRPDLEYVSMQFLKMDRSCHHQLGSKILDIQRQFLSRC